MSFPNPRITPASIGPGGGIVGDFVYFEDWIGAAIDAGGEISVAANTGHWFNSETNSGTVTIADDEPGGVLRLLTDTADNDAYDLQLNGESFKVAADKDIFWEMRLKFTSATTPLTTIDWVVGLATTDTAIMDGTTEFIGFRTGGVDVAPLDAGAADIICSVGNTMAGSWTAATISEADTGVNYVDDTFLVLAFHVIGNQRVKFYVNGNEKGNFATAANIPTGDAVTLTMAIQNNGGEGKEMLVDYIYCSQVR